MGFWIGFTAALLGTSTFAAEVAPANSLEDGLAAAFEKNDCPAITRLANGTNPSRFSPLAQAVIGYCDPNPFKGDQALQAASARDRSDELIAWLFAKRNWLRDPASSMLYWRRALLVARTPALRGLIQSYINGTAAGDEEFHGLDSSSEASALISVNNSDNPVLYPISENPKSTTFGLETQEEYHYAKRTEYGLWGVDGSLKTLEYFRHPEVDFQGLDLEVPLSLHIGKSQNLIFAPIGGYSRQGSQNLESYYGVLVKAYAYAGDFRNSVQGAIYQDNLYPTYVTSQSGTHFNFSYEWQWVTSSWDFKLNPFIDHVTADADLDQTTSGTYQIPYSYTAIGGIFSVTHSIGNVEIEFYNRLNLRFDDLDSVYPGLNNSAQITKTRRDQTLDSKLSITVPVNTSLQVIGWYEWIRTWSNIGASDYEDRNNIDQIAALGLKFLYSSY